MATVPTRRPSLLVNGLPSVDEDIPSNPPQMAMRPAPSAFPVPIRTTSGSSLSPEREAAKLNLFRSMRTGATDYQFKYAWTFYHDKHSDDASYENRQQTALQENIINVKKFWETYNGFPLDSLKMKDSVHFFKRGVQPKWEDPRNVKGGAWTFRVPKEKCEQTWKEFLLLAVGEQFADVIQPKDDLCGLSLSVRFNSNLITIWNRDGDATGTINGICATILSKISPELKPKEGSYWYKKHSEHSGFNEAVARDNERAMISGKIEEAKVQQDEVERMAEEERLKEEEEARRRSRSQTVG